MLSAKDRRDFAKRHVGCFRQSPLSKFPARTSYQPEDLLVVFGCGAVLGLRLKVSSEVELLLPAVSLLADMFYGRGTDVASAHYAIIREITIRGLRLRVEVVLSQCLLIALKMLRRHGFTGLPVEATFPSFL